jgi:hypothetical protein
MHGHPTAHVNDRLRGQSAVPICPYYGHLAALHIRQLESGQGGQTSDTRGRLP